MPRMREKEVRHYKKPDFFLYFELTWSQKVCQSGGPKLWHKKRSKTKLEPPENLHIFNLSTDITFFFTAHNKMQQSMLPLVSKKNTAAWLRFTMLHLNKAQDFWNNVWTKCTAPHLAITKHISARRWRSDDLGLVCSHNSSVYQHILEWVLLTES